MSKASKLRALRHIHCNIFFGKHFFASMKLLCLIKFQENSVRTLIRFFYILIILNFAYLLQCTLISLKDIFFKLKYILFQNAWSNIFIIPLNMSPIRSICVVPSWDRFSQKYDGRKNLYYSNEQKLSAQFYCFFLRGTE